MFLFIISVILVCSSSLSLCYLGMFLFIISLLSWEVTLHYLFVDLGSSSSLSLCYFVMFLFIISLLFCDVPLHYLFVILRCSSSLSLCYLWMFFFITSSLSWDVPLHYLVILWCSSSLSPCYFVMLLFIISLLSWDVPLHYLFDILGCSSSLSLCYLGMFLFIISLLSWDVPLYYLVILGCSSSSFLKHNYWMPWVADSLGTPWILWGHTFNYIKLLLSDNKNFMSFCCRFEMLHRLGIKVVVNAILSLSKPGLLRNFNVWVHVDRDFHTGFWLVDNKAVSQSETMLENPC